MNRSALPIAALLLGLAACQGGAPKGSQATRGFPAPDQEIIFDVAAQTLRNQGFTVDREASSRENSRLETFWLTSLQPFSNMGYRDKATVTVRPVPDHDKYYVVETSVIREHNADQFQPGNAIKADWGNAERVPELESVITQRIEHYFVATDVSPEFRKTYGMEASSSPVIESPCLTPKPKRPPNKPR